MLGEFKQAPRQDTDGAVSVRHIEEGRLAACVVDHGQEQMIVMSQFNATRLFAMLALILGVPLSSKVGKAIKL